MERNNLARPPVAIGGVGGSGTRLVAQLLADLGFFLGADLNESYDNLWFTLLFKRREILQAGHEELADLIAIFRGAMTNPRPLSTAQLGLVQHLAEADRLAHDAEWLRHRALSLESWSARGKPTSGAWGWKEPNTHVVLERLEPLLPGMKYIHVVRNGLDMAYSSNQSQLRLWGPSFLGCEEIADASPRLSLKYWHAVHRAALDHRRRLGNRFLLLNYDRLCTDPEESLGTLLHFLEAEPARSTLDRLLASIRPPESVGRFRQHPPSDFDPEDVAFARELGFDTDYGR
ncbi:MAG TPA: sulfotransferase [Thermoanaerobaculia bacterium]|nr:sulfotransferase [Thermoanaerobaculia bacterium]